jgi:hypothetical protein
MSDDLDALLARLDARTQAFTGHHIYLERDAAAAIRELLAEVERLSASTGLGMGYWVRGEPVQKLRSDLDAARERVEEIHREWTDRCHDLAVSRDVSVSLQRDLDAARADLNLAKDCAMDAAGQRARAERERDAARAEVERLRADNERGAWIDRAERAEAEVERLKDPDGDHHYMKRLLAQERERARIAELCECGEPECIKQQVTEQRLRAERAEALGRELAGAGRGADWVLALMKDQIDHEDPDVVAAEAALSAALARAKDAGWL